MEGHHEKRRRLASPFRHRWGTSGTGDGEMNGPSCVRVGLDGMVYISDTNNNRIQVFTPTGAFLRKWGRYGTGDGEFNRPTGMSFIVGASSHQEIVDQMHHVPELYAFPPGVVPICAAYAVHDKLYVSDSKNRRIQVFSWDGYFLSKWTCIAEDSISWSNKPFTIEPEKCSTDACDNVIIASSNRVGCWSQHGTFVRWIHQFTTIYDIAVTNRGHLFTTGVRWHHVDCSKISNGRRVHTWEHLQGLFQTPSSMATDQKNNILYVLDTTQQCIIGLKVRGAGCSNRLEIGTTCEPRSLDVTSSGIIYLLDPKAAEILVMDPALH